MEEQHIAKGCAKSQTLSLQATDSLGRRRESLDFSFVEVTQSVLTNKNLKIMVEENI